MGKTKKKTPTTDLPVIDRLESDGLHRGFTVERDTLDSDARTVEIAVSSEYPFDRCFGVEVLDHSPDAVDLSRLKSGAPLLDQHNGGRQIGVVEDAWLDVDRKLRARVRFSRSAVAEDVWRDVVDGIRCNVSMGYIIREMMLERTENGIDHYRVTRWEPYEVSSVSIPADPTVGVGRSLTHTHTITVKGTTPMDLDTPTAEPTDAAAQERRRCADIYALGDQHNQRELAAQAINDGSTPDAFARSLLSSLGTPKPTTPAAPKQQERDLPSFVNAPGSLRELGVSDKEASGYSLMNAIRAAAENDWKKAGFERELSVAIADKCKREARGFYVPHEILTRSLSGMSAGTPGRGQELIATDLRDDLFIDILRNETVIAKLGARILSGLQGDVDLPRKNKGATFSWIKEGESAPLSELDLGTLRLSPKTISGGIPITRKLRQQSSRSVEALIVNDLIEGLAGALDLAMLAGSGKDDEPLGLLNQLGLAALTYTGAMTWRDVVAMETRVRQANARKGALHYLTGIAEDGDAKTREKFEHTGKAIAENGQTNGYPLVSTNQMPDHTWLFGDFSQIVAGMWGVMDLKPDAAALAGSDGLILRVFQDADVGIRRPESFAVARKA